MKSIVPPLRPAGLRGILESAYYKRNLKLLEARRRRRELGKKLVLALMRLGWSMERIAKECSWTSKEHVYNLLAKRGGCGVGTFKHLKRLYLEARNPPASDAAREGAG